MRRILYNREGAAQHYLTGAGVLYDLSNTSVGTVQDVQVLNRTGQVVAWFDGSFVWDATGVLAFVKGAEPQGGLELPKTAPLRAKLSPTPAPLYPLQRHIPAPPCTWLWSTQTLTEVLSAHLYI